MTTTVVHAGIGARDKRSIGASRVAVTSHRKDLSSAQRLLQPGEDLESAVATALVSFPSSLMD